MKQGVTYDGWSIGTTAIRVEVLTTILNFVQNARTEPKM